MDTVRNLIGRWDRLGDFARSVGCAPATANHWRRRDSIPAEWFAAVARAAQAKGFQDVTPDALARRAERKRLVAEMPIDADGAPA